MNHNPVRGKAPVGFAALTYTDKLDKAPAHTAQIILDRAAGQHGHIHARNNFLKLDGNVADFRHGTLVKVIIFAELRLVPGGVPGAVQLQVRHKIPVRIAESMMGLAGVKLLARRKHVGTLR